MGIFLQPDCSSALQVEVEHEADTNHFGIFSGLDNMFAHSQRTKGKWHGRNVCNL